MPSTCCKDVETLLSVWRDVESLRPIRTLWIDSDIYFMFLMPVQSIPPWAKNREGRFYIGKWIDENVGRYVDTFGDSLIKS